MSLAFVPLSAPGLPPEDWLRDELARPIHKMRHFTPEKLAQAIPKISALATTSPDAGERQIAKTLLNMLGPITLIGSVEEQGTMSFSLKGFSEGIETNLGFGLMPAPIPASELQAACESSWRWPEATEAC